MAETSYKETIFQYCKNPKMRDLFMLLYETSTGHNHDGTNSAAVSVGTVGDGLVTNAKLATDVKVGSLASLTTTETASIVGAINELVLDIGVASAKVGTLSALTTTAKANTVVAINELVTSITGLVSLTGAQTLTNKHLTIAHLTTPLIEDGDTGVSLTSADQTHAAPTVTIPDIGDAADTFCMIDTEQTLTLKTLTTPIVASFYQDAGKTKLMTVPNVASDTLCVIGAAQTLINKTLTAPAVTSPDTVEGVSAHDYAGGASDWTLSASELKSKILTVTNSSGAVNLIAPLTAGRVYIVYNGTGSNLTVKGSSGTTVVIATTKTAMVRSDGTNYLRVTADA